MFIELLQHFGLYLMLKFASSNAYAVLHHHSSFVATVYKEPSGQNEVFGFFSNLDESDAQGLAKDKTLLKQAI